MDEKTGNENSLRMTVQVSGDEDLNEICYMIRALFKANGNSDGHAKTNKEFRRGANVTFGTAPMAAKFVKSLERLFRKRVRKRIDVKRY